MTQREHIFGKLTVVASAALIFAAALPAYAVDSASAEFATGNKTQMARLGVQWNWQNRWWESGGRHLGGYWDLTVAQWRGTRFENRDATQNITDIGLTPVFRYGADNGKGLYGELGVGAHLLSDLYDNNGRRLSTRFEFGDHIGAGYVFANGLDVGVKFQHFSNGGIKQPNNGVNFGVVRVAYPF